MGVAKLLPEESLSRDLWVKSNALPCPEHRLGLPLGVLLNPICQHPSRSDVCSTQLPELGHRARKEGDTGGEWKDGERGSPHLKYTIQSSGNSLIHSLLS